MAIKVFNKETALVETIEEKDFVKTKHVHRNTHKEFTKEELETFGIVEEKAKKKLDTKEEIVEEKKELL